MYLSETRDPTIGTHALMLLAEIQLAQKEKALKKFRSIAEDVWKNPDALEPNFDFESKVPVAIWSQRMHQLNDSLPLCDMAFPSMMKRHDNVQDWDEDDKVTFDQDVYHRMLNAVTGGAFSLDDLFTAADRAFSIERCLLARAGRSRRHEERLASHFELPCRDDGTRLTESAFSKMMDAYYSARGWDLQDGWPLSETLVELGLQDVAADLGDLRVSRED
jgi:aldehyde:ferredoxin oxidoreductase